MAKSVKKKAPRKKVAAKAVKKVKAVKVKKPASKTGPRQTDKAKAAKVATKGITAKTSLKTPKNKQPSAKKPSTNIAFKPAHAAANSHTQNGVKPAEASPIAPAELSRATPQPAAKAPAAAAPDTPAVSTSPAPASPASQGAMQGTTTTDKFPPGKRVRHRYEHWWGTIVRKVDNSSDAMAAPSPVRYVVTVDGGMYREDIRPEDLTTS